MKKHRYSELIYNDIYMYYTEALFLPAVKIQRNELVIPLHYAEDKNKRWLYHPFIGIE